MKTINFILHIAACIIFAVGPVFEIPCDLAIMLECFAIFNNTQNK